MNFVPVCNIKLKIVGKQYDNGSVFHFVTADVWLNCGMTKKNEYTLGQDGFMRIVLDGLTYHGNRQSVLNNLKKDTIDDYSTGQYVNWRTWLQISKDKGHKFTDAVMNNILKKTNSSNLWIHKEWWIKSIDDVLTIKQEKPFNFNNKFKKELHLSVCQKCGISWSTYPYLAVKDFTCTECKTKETIENEKPSWCSVHQLHHYCWNNPSTE